MQAETWAHDSVTRLLAQAAANTDRDRLGKISAVTGNIGVGIPHPLILIGRPLQFMLHCLILKLGDFR